MKIIVANSYAPFPVTKGIDRLLINLLNGLSARHDVVLVTMALDREQLSRLRELESPRLSVCSILAPNKRSVLHKALFKTKNAVSALLSGTPMQVSYAAPREYLELVAKTARGFGADLVLACYWHLFALPDYLSGTRLALITMDLDFMANRRRIECAQGTLRKSLAAIRASRGERIELEAYNRHDTIIAVTHADAEALRSHRVASGKSIHTLPLAIDLGYFDGSAFARERERVLLLGAFHADFNLDALRFFLRDIWPLVVERRPNARLDVVGYGVPRSNLNVPRANVNLVGGVDDVRPYLGRCTLMVLPLRFGGGVRIRMMEAAAMGTPVVSTSVGVAGMGLEPGRDYVQGDSPEDFSAAILRLLDAPREAELIGASARRWAERNISTEDYADRLDNWLERIMSSDQSPSRGVSNRRTACSEK